MNLVKKADFRIFNRPIHIPLGFRAVLISYVTLAKVQFNFATIESNCSFKKKDLLLLRKFVDVHASNVYIHSS